MPYILDDTGSEMLQLYEDDCGRVGLTDAYGGMLDTEMIVTANKNTDMFASNPTTWQRWGWCRTDHRDRSLHYLNLPVEASEETSKASSAPKEIAEPEADGVPTEEVSTTEDVSTRNKKWCSKQRRKIYPPKSQSDRAPRNIIWD